MCEELTKRLMETQKTLSEFFSNGSFSIPKHPIKNDVTPTNHDEPMEEGCVPNVGAFVTVFVVAPTVF